mgnify:FL=1
MTNIMLDLETLGIKSDSVILSIGAVYFDEKAITEEFYTTINMQSCVDYGLKIYPHTLQWWMNQSDKAKIGLFDSTTSLPDALMDFSKWVLKGADEVRMWGNGEDFDNVLLRQAYLSAGFSPLCIPWNFRNNMSYRTLKNLLPHVKMDRIGEHHNALDDAKSQALHSIQLLKELENGSKK